MVQVQTPHSLGRALVAGAGIVLTLGIHFEHVLPLVEVFLARRLATPSSRGTSSVRKGTIHLSVALKWVS